MLGERPVILGLPAGELALIAAVVVLGATVQGLVGLGLGLVAAPVVTLLEPALMPELLLVLAALLPALTLAHSHEQVDWPGLAWVMPARVPGTVVGVLLLGWFSDRALGLAVGTMVLAAVAVSLRSVTVPVTPPTLLAAGFASGIAGTATSIGGPPVALLYQRRSATQVRSTLAVFFAGGAVLSLAGIGVGGHLSARALLLAAVLSPCLLVGAVLGVRTRGLLPERGTRTAVLGLCAASALVLLVRSLS